MTAAGALPEPLALTIDELTAATGVPSRTIRLYQTKAVLPAPERRGRISYYSQGHVDRLRLIGELQDRGLQLSAIRDVLNNKDGDVSLRDWFGIGDQLTRPWSEDAPAVYTADQMDGLLKDRRTGTLAALVRNGLLERRGEGAAAAAYFAPSPGLLHDGLALDDAGVDLDTSSGARDILRRRLSQAVDELMELLIDRTGQGFGGDGPESVAVAFEAVRTTGGDAVRLIFAAEVERAINRAVADGTLASKRNRRRKK